MLGTNEIRPQKHGRWSDNEYGLRFELGEPDSTGGVSYRGCTMNRTGFVNLSYRAEHKEQCAKAAGKDFSWPAEAVDFFNAYNTPGNFMVLPWKGGFDIAQDVIYGGYRDSFDLFLLGIYNRFLEADGQEPVYGIRGTYSFYYSYHIPYGCSDGDSASYRV